ncbi:alkylated DNA repair protein alkB homolog 8 isoform X2 [Ambystoma mexicanum]|uniref:alkylated DNA repair protein alkB homolog 8 isoform X2 n=1 Tax=Ambystoma mexicanum TaxID=8296 RepID=UPI0037E7FFC8
MDCEGQRNPKLSKRDKKLLRKQNKARHTLLRHEGIESVSHATQNLVVANGGLGNGVHREKLLCLLEKCGIVKNLSMPPNKPYCFVRYETVEDAKRAYTTLSGQEIISHDSNQSISLYLNFVERVHSEDCAPPPLPPGLIVIEDFVTADMEESLLQSIDWSTDKENETAEKSLKHRRVKHYGFEFRYDNNNVDKDKPLPGGFPEICSTVLDKVLAQGLLQFRPDQLTVNQYEPGQGIPPHIDTHSAFEDGLASLSLGAQIVMDFKHPDGRIAAVMLPRRSLLVMTGESRYLWSHGITPRKFDLVQVSEGPKSGTISVDAGDLTLNKRGTRTSFTFRKVRQTPCNCAHASVCDSQKSQQKDNSPSIPDSNTNASKLEKEYVHQVYEEIAAHFSSTRHTPWPRIFQFLNALPKGSLVADIGCGNGKYLGAGKQLYMVGCDRSRSLVDICGKKNFEAFVGDALSIPLRSATFDAVISIAVIHHFSTEERRLAAISELARLLRPGGTALIYVWAMEQEYKKQKSKYLKENRDDKVAPGGVPDGPTETLLERRALDSSQGAACSGRAMSDLRDKACRSNEGVNPRLPVHTNRTAFDAQDVLVPWHLKSGNKTKGGQTGNTLPVCGLDGQRDGSAVFHRYYHVYCEGELEAACKKLSNTRVQQSYHDQGNWCVVLEKLSHLAELN